MAIQKYGWHCFLISPDFITPALVNVLNVQPEKPSRKINIFAIKFKRIAVVMEIAFLYSMEDPMRLKFVIATLTSGLLSPLTLADVCALPEQPVIPDGKTASGADMLKAKRAVDDYMNEIDLYLKCDATPIKQRRAQMKVEALINLLDEQMESYSHKK